MKKTILAAMALALAASAQTAPDGSTRVAVIQVQSALLSTKEGKKAAAEFQARIEPRSKALERKAAEIRDLQDRLQRGGNNMAESAKQELTRSIDAKTTAYNRDMEDARAEADEAQRAVLQDLTAKMTQVIDVYAKAHGYAIVIDVSNPNTPVLYASNTIEITNDIVEAYDKAPPVVPGSGAGAPAPARPPAAKPTAPPATQPPAVKKQQ
jgi:outer membrane protein